METLEKASFSALDITTYMNLLSVVIIGKNAAWSIARLLDSVIARMPAHITSELIYVDSASDDNSVEIVRQYPVKIIRLSASQHLCASAGRFIGAQHATGRYILFIDSDMELLNGWLERAIDVLDQYPDIAVVSGIEVNIDSQKQVATESPGMDTRLTEVRFAGNAAVFRHEVLDAVGTWNPYIISDEEPELCLRIRCSGFRIMRLSNPSVYHFCTSAYRLSTLLSRRKRRLFLGYGQAIRYHLHTGVLPLYLRERGFALMPALACGLVIVSVLLSYLFQNVYWIVGLLVVLSLAFAVDAVRSRSIYAAVFHVAHRVLILEGTLKGLIISPRPRGEYPGDFCHSVDLPHLAADD